MNKSIKSLLFVTAMSVCGMSFAEGDASQTATTPAFTVAESGSTATSTTPVQAAGMVDKMKKGVCKVAGYAYPTRTVNLFEKCYAKNKLATLLGVMVLGVAAKEAGTWVYNACNEEEDYLA